MNEPLKVIAVDADGALHAQLKNLVNWQAMGLALCDTTQSAQDALRLAAATRPDIMVLACAFAQPALFSLAEQLRHSFPALRLVFVTSGATPALWRRAVQLGAVDCLPHPPAKSELEAALQRAAEQVLAQQCSDAAHRQQQHLQTKQALHTLLFGSATPNEEQEHLKTLCFAQTPFFCLVAEIDRQGQAAAEGALRTHTRQLCRLLCGLLPPGLRAHSTESPTGRVTLVGTHAAGEAFAPQLALWCETVRADVERTQPFTVTLAVSSPCSGDGAVQRAYAQCLTALESKLFSGGNRVAYYVQEHPRIEACLYFGRPSTDLLRSLHAQDRERIREVLSDVFLRISSQKLSREAVLGICSGIVLLCLSYITEAGFSPREVYGEEFLPFTQMRAFEAAGDLAAWLKTMFCDAIDYCAAHRITKARHLAQRIQTYLEDNFANPRLSADAVASALYMNPDYLRATFKREMKVTIQEYLTEQRLQHAKHLLAQGEKKLSEIAELCGFNDAAYFSRCFKKHVGVSPSTYETICRK